MVLWKSWLSSIVYIIKVKDMTTNKVFSVQTSRLRLFRHPTETKEEIEVFASVNLDKYYVEKITTNEDKSRNLEN